MKVMIYSNEHKMWWRPDYCGYTWHQEEAGIFDYEEAHKKYPEIDFNTDSEDFFVIIDVLEILKKLPSDYIKDLIEFVRSFPDDSFNDFISWGGDETPILIGEEEFNSVKETFKGYYL